jgi:hypothetical protein
MSVKQERISFLNESRINQSNLAYRYTSSPAYSRCVDAEHNRQKSDDRKAGLIQTRLRAAASPEHKLPVPGTHQSMINSLKINSLC